MIRHLILASGAEGIEGFRQRWSLHGRMTDTKYCKDTLSYRVAMLITHIIMRLVELIYASVTELLTVLYPLYGKICLIWV